MTLENSLKRIMGQFANSKSLTMNDLMRRNWKYLTQSELEEHLITLKAMGLIRERPIRTSGINAGARSFDYIHDNSNATIH